MYNKKIILTEEQKWHLILESMSVNDIYQKYYSDIPEDVYNAVITQADPTYNPQKPDKMGIYTKWLLGMVRKGTFKVGDVGEAKNLLGIFHKFKSNLEVKDITQLHSMRELYDVVKPVIGQQTKGEKEREAKTGAEKVYEDNKWLVVVPHTEESAKLYGKGTKWCTAADNNNMFEYYSDNGPLYIIINKSNPDEKYQFHFESKQYMDAEDEEINLLEFFEREKQLAKFFGDLLMSQERFGLCCSVFGIKDFVIPDGVTEIVGGAFLGCESLTSINIPDSVTEIGVNAFSECKSLTSINIPASVTEIGEFAFANCSSLTSINIPASVAYIGICAFQNCQSLTSINIPDGVTEIVGGAFWGCESLTSINIPDSVTRIGDFAFYYCKTLTSITIPESVTVIERNTFSRCYSLTSINIPEGVTKIGKYAFYNCESLTSITIPAGVAEIGRGAFWGCKSLTSITIPASVTEIGAGTFYDCPNLTVYVPNERVAAIVKKRHFFGPIKLLPVQESKRDKKNKKTVILSEEQKQYILNESADIVWDYMETYDASYILDHFKKGKKMSWGPLINPSMYQKALNIFTRQGTLDGFPIKYVYQWMGIILKNISLFNASTTLWRHSSSYPEEIIEDFVKEKYNGFLQKKDYMEMVYVPVSEEYFLSVMNNKPLNEEHGIHRNGQYDLFLNQQETDEWDKWYENRDAEKKFEKYAEMAKGTEEIGRRMFFKVDIKNRKIYQVWEDFMDFFDYIGLYDYLILPDGSDALSDYALSPLWKLAKQYDEDMSPEEVLILINKILDVSHPRGDLSSLFITGGAKTLTQISNTQYVNEGKALNEHKDIVDELGVAADLIREQWKSPDDVWYIKIEARYKDFRGYNRRHGYNFGNPRMIYWKQVDKVDGTKRENHVGFAMITGNTADEAVANLLNCTINLNPWAAKIMGTRQVRSNGTQGEAIKKVCEQFFARAYMTINPRSMKVSQNKAEDYKRKGIFRGREINHAIGQSKAEDDATFKWTELRPYGLIDCDVDNEKGQKELEAFLERKGIKPFRTYLSHDGKHYILKNRDAQKLDFGFMRKYDTNNRPNDPNVLFKGDANMLLYSAVGV